MASSHKEYLKANHNPQSKGFELGTKCDSGGFEASQLRQGRFLGAIEADSVDAFSSPNCFSIFVQDFLSFPSAVFDLGSPKY